MPTRSAPGAATPTADPGRCRPLPLRGRRRPGQPVRHRFAGCSAPSLAGARAPGRPGTSVRRTRGGVRARTTKGWSWWCSAARNSKCRTDSSRSLVSVNSTRTSYGGGVTSKAAPPVGYDPSAYPPFAVTVDIVVLTIRDASSTCSSSSVETTPTPAPSPCPAGSSSTTRTSARPRHASSRRRPGSTPSDLPAGALVQLGAYGDPARDPRMRVVTVAYLAVVRSLGKPRPGGDAARAEVLPVSHVLGRNRRHRLAFDHDRILDRRCRASPPAARDHLDRDRLRRPRVHPLRAARGLRSHVGRTARPPQLPPQSPLPRRAALPDRTPPIPRPRRRQAGRGLHRAE